MLETIIILMCSCGKPEVLYFQGQNKISIHAYGPLGVDPKIGEVFEGLCAGKKPVAEVKVWHLDKLNSRQCPTIIKHQ